MPGPVRAAHLPQQWRCRWVVADVFEGLDLRVALHVRLPSEGVLEYGRGESATAIARRLGVHRGHIYRWWDTYCQAHDPAALEEAERCGRPCLWTEKCTRWLEELMDSSPREWGHLAVDWTVPLLLLQLEALMGRRFAQGTLRQALHDLGYVWIRSRYDLEPDPELEKKSPNPPANPGFAAPQCAAG